MSHMVIYRGSDGKPGYHQTDDIHDAVGFVEQMRNDQGVEHARIFRLEEVVFQYKPYYRVELAESGFGELHSVADGPTNGGAANGSVHGSTTADITIDANGTNGAHGTDGNGSSDSPASVTAAPAGQASTTTSPSSSSSTTSSGSADDVGGSKRGLFGR